MYALCQVAGETEVKAQIKLRFRTATSQPVVVIRTFQVTQHILFFMRFKASLQPDLASTLAMPAAVTHSS